MDPPGRWIDSGWGLDPGIELGAIPRQSLDFELYSFATTMLAAKRLGSNDVIVFMGMEDHFRNPFYVPFRLSNDVGLPVFISIVHRGDVSENPIDQPLKWPDYLTPDAVFDRIDDGGWANRLVNFFIHTTDEGGSHYPGADQATRDALPANLELIEFAEQALTMEYRSLPTPSFINSVPDSHEGIPIVAQMNMLVCPNEHSSC